MMGRVLKAALGLLILAGLCALPRLFSMDYYMHIFVMSEIYATLALSLALIVGFAGQVSMGHAAFYGMGAYASALLCTKMGWPFWVTFWAGGLFSGVVAYVIGRLVLRLRGHVLAITTAFFCVLATVVMNNWIPVTNGPMGIPGIPRPSPIGLGPLRLTFESRLDYYYLGLVLVLAVLFVLHRIVRSRLGDAMAAIRENEELAVSLGVDAMKVKLFAFTVGGGVAGLAGAFYAHYILFISPVTFTMNESINMLVMVIFGGMSTLFGPILGAVTLTVLPELLRMAGELRLVIYGVALVCFIIWLPMGLWGTLRAFVISLRAGRAARG